jgi:hypothetical protein
VIIYSVTIKIDKPLADEWITWMRSEHIPDVMATGCFLEHRVLRLMLDEDDGSTFSIQYKANSMDEISKYQDKFAAELQQKHIARFKDKFVAFRTLLEELE